MNLQYQAASGAIVDVTIDKITEFKGIEYAWVKFPTLPNPIKLPVSHVKARISTDSAHTVINKPVEEVLGFTAAPVAPTT